MTQMMGIEQDGNGPSHPYTKSVQLWAHERLPDNTFLLGVCVCDFHAAGMWFWCGMGRQITPAGVVHMCSISPDEQ